MKAIPVTHSVDEAANFLFRLRIDTTDTRHDTAAKFGGDTIRHYEFTRLISGCADDICRFGSCHCGRIAQIVSDNCASGSRDSIRSRVEGNECEALMIVPNNMLFGTLEEASEGRDFRVVHVPERKVCKECDLRACRRKRVLPISLERRRAGSRLSLQKHCLLTRHTGHTGHSHVIQRRM